MEVIGGIKMNLSMITRAQWKDIRDRIKKGGIQELKSFVENVAHNTLQEGYQLGYEKGINNGVDATKTSIMQVVDDTLRKEFGFADKRLARFHERFIEETHLKAQALRESNEEKREDVSVQQPIITEEDKQRYMVLTCMAEFIDSTRNAQSTVLFKGKSFELDSIYDHVLYVLHKVKNEIGPDVDDALMEELKSMSLYVAPTVLPKESKEV